MNDLIIHHHSKLEVLAERLAKTLEEEKPSHPFTAQKVLVAHPGIGQWLRRFLAARRVTAGPRIVAHLHTPLLGEYLQREFQTGLKLESNPVFDGAPFSLAIFDALRDHEGLQEASHYLVGNDDKVQNEQPRRWQLANSMATVFSKYLRYRPEWIAAWEAGGGKHWQAILWRRLIAQHGQQHYAFLMQSLLQPKINIEGESLHCFGFTHLPPSVLQLLAQRAESQSVTIYFPNPCHEFWGAIESRRKITQAQLRDDAEHREIGHPLLASLGAQGQAFFNRLADLTMAQIEENDTEASYSSSAEPFSTSKNRGVLATLQEEIRSLKLSAPITDRLTNSGNERVVAIDDSVLIIAAATRLRELEILRERLLTLLQEHPDLHAGDIIVLSPAIDAYAALVPAVFDGAEVARLLPFRLVDRSIQNHHPLLHSGAQLLSLRETRFAVSEVLSFLEQPALARRFGLDSDEINLLLPWLKDSHVAWGLDSAFRAALGAGSDGRNTWAAALDRLWLGYFNGGDTIVAERAAVLGVEGQRTRLLAALDGLLAVLSAAWRDLERARPLAHWAQWWQRLLTALFDADYHDRDAQAALQRLRELATNLAEAALTATVNEDISWPVWRDMLRNELQAHTTASALPVGSILFCGMVPFRSLPFRVVAILGLNDGEFPREDSSFMLDRTRLDPRPDDRRLREEDRYLFLESIMSARTALHLSYLGEDQRNGSPKPPAAPLAELIEHLHERFAPFGSALSTTSAVWHRHAPLQPFDRRHLEATEPSLKSHAGSWHTKSHIATTTTASLLPRQTIDDIDTLIAFYRHPARFYFTRCLKTRIDINDDRPADSETLNSGLANRYSLQLRLLDEALQNGELPTQAPASWHAQGILPAGSLGALTWKRLCEEVQEIFDLLQVDYAHIIQQPSQHLKIELDLGDAVRLRGQILNVRGNTLLRYRPKGTRASDRIAFFIEWAAASLASGQALQAVLLPAFQRRVIKGKPRNIGPQLHWKLNHAQLRSALRRLIAIAESGTQQCLPLPIETAYAWFEPETIEIKDRLALARNTYGLETEEADGQNSYQRYKEAEDVYWRLRFSKTPLLELDNPELSTFAELSEEIFTWVTPLETDQ